MVLCSSVKCVPHSSSVGQEGCSQLGSAGVCATSTLPFKRVTARSHTAPEDAMPPVMPEERRTGSNKSRGRGSALPQGRLKLEPLSGHPAALTRPAPHIAPCRDVRVRVYMEGRGEAMV